MNFVIDHSYLIPLLPLIGAIIAGFFGAKHLKQNSHWPIWIGVGISAILSLTLLVGMLGSKPETKMSQFREGHRPITGDLRAALSTEPSTPQLQQDVVEEHAPTPHVANVVAAMSSSVGISHTLFTWIQAGPFKADAGFWFDPLSATMLGVVCGIGFLITVFAAGYMKGEEGYFRFFAYLGLFIFMMTNLVMGENLIMLYLGWEGVGLCSYLLIGYYYERPAAREAAKKAFLVNRVGDFGFGIGIMLTYYCFGTVSYFGDGSAHGAGVGFMQMATAMAAHPGTEHLVKWIPFCLMLGAFGKSAQFPLYVWLPDAMEGPTPVSALIHAATMVTAGIYMICRCSVLFAQSEAALLTVAIVGTFTALFAGIIALRQFDLKKVFAYSTVSQLGFMFAGVGVLAPVAGVFHLVTHAFFKALLFLSSGVVMHAMFGHLDMRKMSGLKTVLPKTRWLILIGCLALAGFPLTSGFFSKDAIIGATGSIDDTAHHAIYAVLLFTAFLTAYYTFRLYFRVFEGPTVTPKNEDDAPDVIDAQHSETAPAHFATGLAAHEVAYGHSGEQKTAETSHAAASHDSHGADHGHHDHEPPIMIWPLYVLAAGALLAGLLLGPTEILSNFLSKSASFTLGYESAAARLGASPELQSKFGLGEAHEGMMGYVIGSVVALAGMALAFLLHFKNRPLGNLIPDILRGFAGPIEDKFWVDQIYQALIVEPLRFFGKVSSFLDRWLVDGLVSVVSVIPWLGGAVLKLTVQRGYLQGYAVAMLFGVAVVLLAIFL